MPRPRLPVYYDALYSSAIDDRARFPKARYRLVRQGLDEAWAQVRSARDATREELTLVHDPAYVDAFLEGRMSEAQIRRIGFRPWTRQFVARTLRLTGASLDALRTLLDGESRYAANLAGGTHHAFRDAGEGYCVFNDIAICAEVAQMRGMRQVLVVDLDVHQGNGTAAIFAHDDGVFTFSMHGRKNYPFRKPPSDLDIALDDGCEDAAYLSALAGALDEIATLCRPQLLIFQAGVDALASDALGRLNLSFDGLARRNAMVFEFAERLDVPVLILMGGGYSDPIADSVAAHVEVFRQAAAREAQYQGT